MPRRAGDPCRVAGRTVTSCHQPLQGAEARASVRVRPLCRGAGRRGRGDRRQARTLRPPRRGHGGARFSGATAMLDAGRTMGLIDAPDRRVVTRPAPTTVTRFGDGESRFSQYRVPLVSGRHKHSSPWSPYLALVTAPAIPHRQKTLGRACPRRRPGSTAHGRWDPTGSTTDWRPTPASVWSGSTWTGAKNNSGSVLHTSGYGGVLRRMSSTTPAPPRQAASCFDRLQLADSRWAPMPDILRAAPYRTRWTAKVKPLCRS